MKLGSKLKYTATAVATAFTFATAPTQVVAYQVDCAILLCLSGGWPASAECAHARAVFIRRITPWPIEPPLQIWRCPMGISYDAPQRKNPLDNLIWAAYTGHRPNQSSIAILPWTEVAQSTTHVQPQPIGPYSESEAGLPEAARLYLAQAVGEGSDIDISDPAFDFVRSIKVWDVRYFSHRERGRDDDCRITSNIRLGTYGRQGDFTWARASWQDAPSWVLPTTRCTNSSFRRGVGVEWHDYEGIHGDEWVSY